MSDHALAPIGHNAGTDDEDEFVTRLKAEHAQLVTDMANMELAAARLPKTVDTEEDAAKVTAFVVKGKALRARIEAARVDAKEPFLSRSRQVDGTMAPWRDRVEARWKAIEQRNTAYLKAKRDKEIAEANERVRLARVAADAERLRQANEEAAAKRLRDEADAAARKIREAVDEPAREEAAQEARDLDREAQTAEGAAEQAGKDARALEKVADRNERIAAGAGPTKLEQTRAGGGSATLSETWTGTVESWPGVLQSLGPLGPFLNEDIIRAAVQRAAKAVTRPDIPGVTWRLDVSTQTRATKAPS